MIILTYEEEIGKVRVEVEKAVGLIRENHSGANLKYARKFLI